MRVAQLDSRLWMSPERMRSEQLFLDAGHRWPIDPVVGATCAAECVARRWESFGVAVPGDPA